MHFISREITRQVSRKGFASLSDKQRGQLEGVTCEVTREYRDFVRSAFGAHGHGKMDFIYFCEAQLVWDTAMAINAITTNQASFWIVASASALNF